jgi:tetratricopeptide (TPR) repeat protein
VRTRAPTLDPVELRSRAFGALRDMLTRIGDRRPLVVIIDDAQWADQDSFGLLSEITRAPDAPRMLLVATARMATTGSETTLANQRIPMLRFTRALGITVRDVALGPLSEEESRELARALSHRLVGSDAFDVDAIARESQGHPLFIDLLARQSVLTDGTSCGPLRLDAAVGAQLAALDDNERSIVEIVALENAPLAQRVVERATGVAPDTFTRSVQRLRVARLVLTTGARGADVLEPYHDRVRTAVGALLTDPRRKEAHAAIARALAAERDADPEALAFHWNEAGDTERAATFSGLSGDRAAAALAFDRAAGFFEQALALHEPPEAERRGLYVKLGDALANAGRGERAARAYERAVAGAMAADALDLRQRAAVQLLRGGQFDEGVDAIRAALESVGIGLPRTPLQAILVLLFYRFLIRVRSMRFRERDASQVARSELTRIDTCRLAALSLGNVEVIRGSALQARELLLALRCGEPGRVARALTQEIGHLSTEGGPSWKRTGAILTRVEPMVARMNDDYAHAMVALARALRLFLTGRFEAAQPACDRATELFRECPGAYWEADLATRFSLESLFYLGELRELARRASREFHEAKGRGNLFAWVTLSLGACAFSALATDDAARVRETARAAMDAWTPRAFDLVHYYELYTLTYADLYEGRAEEAHARIVERWPALERSFLMRVQFVRVMMQHCRAGAALALYARTKDASLLADATRLARKLERERMAWSLPFARLMRAGIARARGDDTASDLAREAAVAADEAKMAMVANVARCALAAIVGGDEGTELGLRADEWFRAQGIKRPDRIAAMIAPGLCDSPNARP